MQMRARCHHEEEECNKFLVLPSCSYTHCPVRIRQTEAARGRPPVTCDTHRRDHVMHTRTQMQLNDLTCTVRELCLPTSRPLPMLEPADGRTPQTCNHQGQEILRYQYSRFPIQIRPSSENTRFCPTQEAPSHRCKRSCALVPSQ